MMPESFFSLVDIVDSQIKFRCASNLSKKLKGLCWEHKSPLSAQKMSSKVIVVRDSICEKALANIENEIYKYATDDLFRDMCGLFGIKEAIPLLNSAEFKKELLLELDQLFTRVSFKEIKACNGDTLQLFIKMEMDSPSDDL